MPTTTQRRPPRPATHAVPEVEWSRNPGAAERFGEPRGLVGVYAARAATRGVDLRPIIAAHRTAVDGVPNRTAARRTEDRSAIVGPVFLIGRGTASHRAATRGTRPAGRSADAPSPLPTAPGRLGLRGDIIDLILARVGIGTARFRRNVNRKVLAGGAGVLALAIGAAGTGLGLA